MVKWVTPLNVNINVIRKFGDKIFTGSKKEGAFIIEDNRTVLITPPLLQIKDIKEVAGKIWLITDSPTGGFFGKNGPTYQVEGYTSHPYPDENAEVSDVVEENGEIKFINKGLLDDLDFSNLEIDPGNINLGLDGPTGEENKN